MVLDSVNNKLINSVSYLWNVLTQKLTSLNKYENLIWALIEGEKI